MSLTQPPAGCPECARSDKHAPGRMCPARACYCLHPECPSWEYARPEKKALRGVPNEPNIPESQPNRGRIGSTTSADETPAKAGTSRGRDRLVRSR